MSAVVTFELEDGQIFLHLQRNAIHCSNGIETDIKVPAEFVHTVKYADAWKNFEFHDRAILDPKKSGIRLMTDEEFAQLNRGVANALIVVDEPIAEESKAVESSVISAKVVE